MYGLVVTATTLPEPWAKPDGPYSIFHDVSVPPFVQAKSAELADILDADRELAGLQGAVGCGWLYNSIFCIWSVSPAPIPQGPFIPILAMESLKAPTNGVAVKSISVVWKDVVLVLSLEKL